MNCTKCGSLIPAGEKYCNVCGAELPPTAVIEQVKQTAPVQSTTQVASQINQPQAVINNQGVMEPNKEVVQENNNVQPNVTPNINQPQSSVSSNSQTPVNENIPVNNTSVEQIPVTPTPVVEEKPKKKKSKIGLIVIIILILGVVAFFGWQYFSLMSEANRVKNQQNNNQQEEKNDALIGKVTNNGDNKYDLDVSNTTASKTYTYKINNDFTINLQVEKDNSEDGFSSKVFINNKEVFTYDRQFKDNVINIYVYGKSIAITNVGFGTDVLATELYVYNLNTKQLKTYSNIEKDGISTRIFERDENGKDITFIYDANKISFRGATFASAQEDVDYCNQSTWGTHDASSVAFVDYSLNMQGDALSNDLTVDKTISMQDFYNASCSVPNAPVATPTAPTNPTSPTNPIASPTE